MNPRAVARYADETDIGSRVGDFLELVYGHGEGWVHLSTANKQLTAVETTKVRMLADLDVASGKDVYLSAAVAADKRGTGRYGRLVDGDMAMITALWVDLDRDGEPGHKTEANLWTREDLDALLDHLPISPTVIVDSGGGWWLWFVLNDPIALNDDGQGEQLLARWGRYWQTIATRFDRHVDGVFNASRIARAPGSVNNKEGIPRPATVEAIYPGRFYSLDDLDFLPRPHSGSDHDLVVSFDGGDQRKPGDLYNLAATQDTVVALLERHGFHSPKSMGGRVDLTRPGKQAKDGTSVTVYPDCHTTLWSSAPEGLPGALELRDRGGAHGTYDPFGLYVALEHDGDFRAAARALANVDDQHDIVLVLATPSREALDDDFWSARPEIDHIRQAAHARGRSADAVLVAVLARIAADTPHTVRLPAIVGAPCGLTLISGIAGPPGTGKSSSQSLARTLLPPQVLDPECDGVPPGSGEGLIELLFDWVKDEDPDDGKVKRIHRQVHHNAYVWIDEGEILTKLANQSSNTLLATLREAFTSGVLGQSNASQDKKRIVPAGEAVYGVVLGIQPELAGPLFDEAGAGTPQRFLWASSTTPTPHPDDRPEWPGPLPRPVPSAGDWELHQAMTGHQLGVAPEIRSEIAANDWHRQQHGADPLDEHHDLIRLKVAGCLAILQGFLDITTSDWQLAGQICDMSRQVRSDLVDQLTQRAEEAEAATSRKLARRQVEAIAHTDEWRTVETARRLHDIVNKHPGKLSKGKLRARLAPARRDYFEEALDHAITLDWIQERSESGQGDTKVRYHPGEKTP